MPRPIASMTALAILLMASVPARGAFMFGHMGDMDPTSEGFTPITFGSPSTNAPVPDDMGMAAWMISGTGQDSQYANIAGPLTPAQKTEIATDGFALTMVARVVQGLAPAYTAASPIIIGGMNLDMGTGSPRFDLQLGIDPNGDTVVVLPSSINNLGPGGSIGAPGATYTLTGSGSSYHNYQLVYNPNDQLANLFVDGVLRLSGYAGQTSFRFDRGLSFGAYSGGTAYFASASLTSFAGVVPEPTGFVLMAGGTVGALALAGLRRRRGGRTLASA